MVCYRILLDIFVLVNLVESYNIQAELSYLAKCVLNNIVYLQRQIFTLGIMEISYTLWTFSMIIYYMAYIRKVSIWTIWECDTLKVI